MLLDIIANDYNLPNWFIRLTFDGVRNAHAAVSQINFHAFALITLTQWASVATVYFVCVVCMHLARTN